MKIRLFRTLFLCVYCVLAVVGFVADFGFFAGRITGRPLVFYTSLSNMVCSIFMFAALVQNFRKGKRDPWPGCKFVFAVMILVTAIVYNLLLNSYRSVTAYFADLKNCLYHLILPLLFFLDWLLFYRRGTVKKLYSLLAVLPPLIYVVYILARAAVIKWTGITGSVLYPYFFLNVDRLGWGGFALWMAILLAGILALGCSLYALDRLLCKKAVLRV